MQQARFDDPSRTADYGFFAHERTEPTILTGDDLANAILTSIAPEGAPFSEWVPLIFEGWLHEPPSIKDGLRDFRVWLVCDVPETVGGAMDLLNDIAFDKYGADNE